MRRVLLTVTVLFLGLIVAGFFLFRHSTPETTSISDSMSVRSSVEVESPGTLVEGVTVLRVTGAASRRTGGSQWTPVSRGEKIAVEDAIRTAAGASVTLDLGDESTVELAEQAEVEVRELSGAVQKLGLLSGRASVDYRESGERVLKIENEKGTVVAEVNRGRFSVLNNGAILAVATETGTVNLTSGGETVLVSEGMQSFASEDAPPVEPFAIPLDALLKIADAGCRFLPSGFANVRGTVSRGARVSVNGRSAPVDANGHFFLQLRNVPEEDVVTVRETDVWGTDRETAIRCIRAAQGVGIRELNIDWGKRN